MKQNKFVNAFRFKDRISNELTSGIVYKIQCAINATIMVNA